MSIEAFEPDPSDLEEAKHIIQLLRVELMEKRVESDKWKKLSELYHERIMALTKQGCTFWEPISTAPKRTVAYLVFCPERENTYLVYWDERDEYWNHFGGGMLSEEPSHWMELPENPNK